MSSVRLKPTFHTKNQEYTKMNEKIKKKTINANAEIKQMLKSSDEDFKAVIIKMLQ